MVVGLTYPRAWMILAASMTVMALAGRTRVVCAPRLPLTANLGLRLAGCNRHGKCGWLVLQRLLLAVLPLPWQWQMGLECPHPWMLVGLK